MPNDFMLQHPFWPTAKDQNAADSEFQRCCEGSTLAEWFKAPVLKFMPRIAFRCLFPREMHFLFRLGKCLKCWENGAVSDGGGRQ